jgi:hypothetical protein
LASVQTRAALCDMDEASLLSLVGASPLASGYRVAKVAISAGCAVVSLGGARRRTLGILLRERDDVSPCAYRTRRFNVAALGEGRLPRPEEQALKAFVVRLRSRERVLTGVPRFVDGALPPVASAQAISRATRAILSELERWAEVPEHEPVWQRFASWLLQARVSQRQARAAAQGGMAYDLALSERGSAWRAGITLNPRALPDLAARTLRLVRETGLDLPCARRALATIRPGIFLTVGCVLAGAQAKVKIYAQETTHGEEPLREAEILRWFGALPRGAPRRAAVLCMDLFPTGVLAPKLYVASLPGGLRGAARRRVERFVAESQRQGGFPYVTVRLGDGRSRFAANAVFSTHRSELRRGAWELVRAEVGGRELWDRLCHLRELSRGLSTDLAVTALGVDVDGEERDVYVVPT